MQYKLSDYRFFSRPVKLMLLTELLFGFASGLLSVHLNFFYATAGLSTVNIGVIGVASAVATAVSALLGGYLDNRLGYAPVCICGSILQGLGLIICAATNRFWLILLGQIVYAAGLTFIHAVEFPFITYLTDEKYKMAAYFWLVFAYCISAIFGNLAGSLTLHFTAGMANPYRLSIFVSAAAFLLLSFIRLSIPNANPSAQGGKRMQLLHVLRLGIVRKYLLHYILYYFGLTLVSAMLNLIYRNAFHLSDELIGSIFSVASLITTLALIFVPWLLQRLSGQKISDMLYPIQFATLALSIFAPAPIFVALALIRSVLSQLYPVVIEAQMLRSIDDQWHGSYASMRILAVSIGSGAGSYVSGLLLAYSNYRVMLAIGAAVALLLGLIYWFWCRPAFRRIQQAKKKTSD